MPSYLALATSVKLRIWDPERPWTPLTKDNDQSPRVKGVAARKLRIQKYKEKPVEIGPAKGYVYENLAEEYLEDFSGLQFVDESTPFHLCAAGANVLPSGPGKDQRREQAIDPDDSSDLSSIDSSIFLTQSPPLLGKTPLLHGIEAPVNQPYPLQIVVELSEKSLAPHPNSPQKQEIAINIFFNGELAQSRIFTAKNFFTVIRDGNGPDEAIHTFSGRRVDTNNELPWILLPSLSDLESIDESMAKDLSVENRWIQVNALLAKEADQWGFYDTKRSPMNSYLKALSSLALPASGTDKWTRKGVGIIDVVITLGKAGGSHPKLALHEPQRKLHEGFCGIGRERVVVPDIPRRKHEKRSISVNELNSAPRGLTLDTTQVFPQATSTSITPTDTSAAKLTPQQQSSIVHSHTLSSLAAKPEPGTITPTTMKLDWTNSEVNKHGKPLNPSIQSQSLQVVKRTKSAGILTRSSQDDADQPGMLQDLPRLSRGTEHLKAFIEDKSNTKTATGAISVRELSALIDSQNHSSMIQQERAKFRGQDPVPQNLSIRPAGVSNQFLPSTPSKSLLFSKDSSHSTQITRGYSRSKYGAESPSPKAADVQGEEEEFAATKRQKLASTITPAANKTSSWTPNAICEHSILTYDVNGPLRKIGQEREGVFRTSSILMGVRYIVG